MNKRNLIIFLLIALPVSLFIGPWVPHLLTDRSHPGIEYDCPLCRDNIIREQSLYEGQYLRVLANYAPILTGHLMIIPKRHVERIEHWNADELIELGQLIKKVQSAFDKVYHSPDFLIVMQNGLNAGQTVFHSHFHLLPRENASLLTKFWLWGVVLTRPLNLMHKKTMTELRTELAPLIEALQE